MKLSEIIKNVGISLIMGILLGAITEFALILNITWLIKITQSVLFWGLIICIAALIPKKFIYSIVNPTIVISLMNITYYFIRLLKSGYTDWEGLSLYFFIGIAGAIYIGTIIYLIKNKFICRTDKCYLQICCFLTMTIIGMVFFKVGNRFPINHNSTYNMDLGIIIGFILGIIIDKMNYHFAIKKMQ